MNDEDSSSRDVKIWGLKLFFVAVIYHLAIDFVVSCKQLVVCFHFQRKFREFMEPLIKRWGVAKTSVLSIVDFFYG